MAGMIISRTPLRISLVGGGTDLPQFWKSEGGAVLGAAISKSVYVLVMSRFENNFRVSYSITEIVGSAREIRHDLVREALRITDAPGHLEIVTVAEIPSEGTGLGSSSATTVGLLNALYQLRGEPQPLSTLAAQACEIEIDILGKPIGKQDQYLTAMGGLRTVTFNPDGTVDSSRLPMSDESVRMLSGNLMLFYTGITRAADSILGEQVRNTETNLAGLRRLRDLVRELEHELAIDNTDAVGEALDEGWSIKTQLARGITNPMIDEAYATARKAGALGGKVTGAGGGGFLLFYVRPEFQAAVRQALSGLRELPFDLHPLGSQTLLDTRA